MDERRSLRWRSLVVIVATLVVVISPTIRNRDSFPLSSYPIYARSRGRVATFDTVVGVNVTGEIERLSLQTIAGTDDPLIASSFVSNTVRAGDADQLCADVAERVGPEVARIEVVSERHDIVDWLRDDDSLQERSVHASCEVPE